MTTFRRWIARFAAFVPLLVLVGACTVWARVGSGEHYDSGRSDSSGDGDGELIFFVVRLLLELAFEHPRIGIPLIIIVVIGYVIYRLQNSDFTSRKALDAAEAERKTTVSSSAVDGWVAALTKRDAAFQLLPFLDRVKKTFLDVQEGWFRRDLSAIRSLVSDATYQRLTTQMHILAVQGIRDAVADMQVFDLKLIGLEQNDHFDCLHVRVTAKARDTDVDAQTSDEKARKVAQSTKLEQFVEVWSFVRKQGAQTKPSIDASQGKCPNCGAPFSGGAANQCEFCKAIVNSGQFDWVLAEITQGSEFSRSTEVTGLVRALQRDKDLSAEALEDRASLIFWKWIDAQVSADATRMAKVALPELTLRLGTELAMLSENGKRKAFNECSVGAVNLKAITERDGFELAHFEIRWSAKSAILAKTERPSNLLSVPNRWVFTLARKQGAATSDLGLATSRCPQCHAPLSDNGQTSCEYCGTVLSNGERDWVLHSFTTWESWKASPDSAPLAPSAAPAALSERVPDQEERERLMYLLAAVAAADGVVDAKELKLLKLASQRYRVPWANVELALKAGPQLFEKLIARGSSDAQEFVAALAVIAKADGKIDRKERALLDAAATHLGVKDKLEAIIQRA